MTQDCNKYFPELERLTDMGSGYTHPFQAVLRLPDDGLVAMAFQETLRAKLGEIRHSFRVVCGGQAVCGFESAEDREQFLAVRSCKDFDHHVRTVHASMVSPKPRF